MLARPSRTLKSIRLRRAGALVCAAALGVGADCVLPALDTNRKELGEGGSSGISGSSSSTSSGQGGGPTSSASSGSGGGDSSAWGPADWAFELKTAGAPAAYELDVAVSTSDIYLGGSFSGSIQLPGLATKSATGVDAFLARCPTAGASPVCTWSKHTNVVGDEHLIALTQENGHFLPLGTFSAALPADWGALTKGASPHPYDVFFEDVDMNSNTVWATKIEDTAITTPKLIPRSIAVDATGQSYVAGTFAGTLEHLNEPGNSVKSTSDTLTDVFVARTEPGGTKLLWKSFGSPTADEAVGGVVVDDSQIYVSGRFTGSMTIDALMLNSEDAMTPSAFVVALDRSTLQPTWATTIKGATSEPTQALALRSGMGGAGGVLLAGSFASSLTTPNGLVYKAGGAQDVYVIAFDSKGGVSWSNTFSTGFDAIALDVAEGPSQSAIVTGYATTGPDALRHLLMLKLSNTGELRCHSALGSGGNQEGRAVAVDASGSAYVIGSFTGVLPLALGSTLINSLGGTNAFVAKFPSAACP